MHPTRKALLDAAAKLLETHHPDAVSGQMVLRESGVSHGSLYHHFEDASDLIETVLIDKFFARAANDLRMIREIFASGSDRGVVAETLLAMTRAAHRPENSHFRMERTQLIAYASSRPRMLARLARQQADLTTGFAEAAAGAQQKGWIHRSIDPHALAVFIQAIILGRIIDDVSAEKVDPEKWDQLISACLIPVLNG